jgi:hypothetical protein
VYNKGMEQEKKLWFKAKTYGWGWTPITWQGWAITLLYIVVSFLVFFRIDGNQQSVSDILVNFVFVEAFLTLLLIWVCYLKGEKPHWSWGRKGE